MKIALDTNVIVAIQKRNTAVLSRLADFRTEDIALPAMVLHELWYGAYNSTKVEANIADI
jgi:tRNA(fMet)-specific endonuclease VapC